MDAKTALGASLAGLGAAGLALSMSVQRHALVTPPPVVSIFGFTLSQCTCWFLGLTIYWIANGLFALSLLYAPLALLGAIWTTLLIWNLFFGWWLLNERLTFIKVLGVAVIMIGVSLIGFGTPKDIPTKYSKHEIVSYVNSTVGLAYLGILIALVTISLVVIGMFEHCYPLRMDDVQEESFAILILKRPTQTVLQNDEAVSPGASPSWLNNVMGVVYPGSLGVDEGIGHLAMKAFMVLFVDCFAGQDCGSSILWGMVAIWLVSSLATLWWLRTVYCRYDVTQALPIEYGAVMVCDALSSILFYHEDAYMDTRHLVLTICGMLTIIIGILLGRIQDTDIPYMDVI